MRTPPVPLLRCGPAAVAILTLLVGPFGAAADQPKDPKLVPLVNPVGESGGNPKFRGLFRKIVTARGADLDDSRTSYHSIKSIGETDTFPSNTPEVYVVIELLQSAFDMFRLIGRFILEDPDGKPIGTLLYTDKAHFEFEDTGGYLVMKRPPGGFPVGNYRVEIHYGDQINDISLLTLARFKVVAPADAASPQRP